VHRAVSVAGFAHAAGGALHRVRDTTRPILSPYGDEPGDDGRVNEFHRALFQNFTGTNRVVNMALSSGVCWMRPISTSDLRSTTSALGSNWPSALNILICSS
jgi:hypothetical protein